MLISASELQCSGEEMSLGENLWFPRNPATLTNSEA